jgi:hypothetical protein
MQEDVVRRIATFVLTAVMAVTVLAGCPQKKGSGPDAQGRQQMEDKMKGGMYEKQKQQMQQQQKGR